MPDADRSGQYADAQKRADVQYAVSRVLSEAATVEDAVRALLPALAEALAWDYAGLWRPSDDGGHLVCADTWATSDPRIVEFARASRESTFAPGRGLPGRSWAEGRAVWLSAVQRDHTLPRVRFARAASLFGGLAFPIATRDGVTGVLEFFTRDRETVTPELLKLTESIGKQIGQFLQRKSAEKRLEENEARYSAIVFGALDAIIVIDENGDVLEFNPASERLFGYTRDEAVGREMASLIIPPDLRDAHRAGLRRYRESGTSSLLEKRLELRAVRHDGTEFPVELTISRIRVGDRWRFLGFLRDITERQLYETEREALISRERGAHAAAVSANSLKDEFLAALSHELRTPLNAVLGWSAMLVRGVVPPDRFPEIAETIQRNAEIQQRLVEDMLDVSAFVAGRLRMRPEPLTLDEPIHNACEVVRPAADAKGVTLRLSVPPIALLADRDRLQQVFWNLFANAVRFTPSGGVVTTTATMADSMAMVSVTDTGQGIEAEFLPYVFDRFRQGRDSRWEGGLGLGLAIVRQIVEAHGGTVTAHSEGIGHGATFLIRLPISA